MGRGVWSGTVSGVDGAWRFDDSIRSSGIKSYKREGLNRTSTSSSTAHLVAPAPAPPPSDFVHIIYSNSNPSPYCVLNCTSLSAPWLPPPQTKARLRSREQECVGSSNLQESTCPANSIKVSIDDDQNESQKKPRFVQPAHLPSPDTHKASNSTEDQLTTSNAASQQSEKPASSPSYAAGLHSPPSDTQPYSQFLPPPPISYEVEDEEAEGVWGYLVPLDGVSEPLVLRRRAACPVPQTIVGRTDGKSSVPRDEYLKQEESYEKEKSNKGVPAGGYLIGRHPECGMLVRFHQDEH